MNTQTLSEKTVKELKDILKQEVDTQGKEMPKGAWKMTKEELINEIESIQPKEESLDKEDKEEKVIKTPKRKSKLVKTVVFKAPNKEEIKIEGIGNFLQFMIENYPEWSAWSMLASILKGKPNRNAKKFLEAGFEFKLDEGFEYGVRNK